MNPAPLVVAWLACIAVVASGAVIAQTASGDEAPNALDEVVTESELERQQQALSRRRNDNSDVDFVTVTRHNTRAGNSSIRSRIQPYSPQREIRLRASDARRLAEGENSRLQLQRDRLTTNGSLIRSVTLEFNVGTDEADGLPAVVRINARTSLFNFDYVRLLNSTQPLIATFRNAMDPETLRCASELSLGIGAEDFHDRFVLLGNGFGDCNGIVSSREEDLIFADSVPQGLRQALRELYHPAYNRFSRTLDSKPGVMFVVWRPESTRNDFRFVRSLNRTSLLVFNGPSWEQGLSAEQRDAIREELAQEGQ